MKYLFSSLCLIFALPFLQAASPKNKTSVREYLPPTLSWLRQVEAVQMFAAIVRGTPPGADSIGWFHPGQSVYGLQWLAERMDKDHDGVVDRREFSGSAEMFDRLDRDHDGRLTRTDFDWSNAAPLNRQMRIVQALFRRADADHNEKLTADEWQAMFRQAAGDKKTLTREQLHALLFPPPASKTRRSKGPSSWTLLKGMLNGEIGSLHEGPSLGRLAPDFALRTFDDSKIISLAQFRGKKPVVLVFGSFT